VLSLASEAERQVERQEEKRRRAAYVLLAVVAVSAGGYHGYNFVRHRALVATFVAARPTRAGAPADATVVETPGGGPIVVRTKGGRAFTFGELKQMEDEEALRGNVVRPVSPSSVVVVPRGSAAGPGAHAPDPGR
jgi:hypothetical protein